MRTAGQTAEDLLVDNLLTPMFFTQVFGVLMCAARKASITVSCDLLFDTRWVRLDKLLQSEAPAGIVSPGRGCWMRLLFENSIVCQVC
ncbi:hypothetical protein CQ018_19760 [Arthrobacter sp. MYb227]|nr:hypothetical protein CQ018_19760 [Arthrobacter sp. MYb227]